MSLVNRANALKLALAATLPFTAALGAHAQSKAGVVLVHSATAGQAAWQDIATTLAQDGFNSVSISLAPDLSPAAGRDKILSVLANSKAERFVLVATDSTSQTVDTLAQFAPAKVKGVILVSSTANAPVDPALAGLPQYNVSLTADKKFKSSNMDSATSFAVPAQNNMANTEVLTRVIESVTNRKTAPYSETAYLAARNGAPSAAGTTATEPTSANFK